MDAADHASAGLGWTDHDRYRALSWLAPLVVVSAVALAAFGMPPISFHGPLHFVGIMDPLCGMTRGTAAVTQGNLADAMRWNPASPLVPLVVLSIMARSLVGVLTGRWLDGHIKLTAPLIMVAAILLLGLGVRQQLHAGLLGS